MAKVKVIVRARRFIKNKKPSNDLEKQSNGIEDKEDNNPVSGTRGTNVKDNPSSCVWTSPDSAWTTLDSIWTSHSSFACQVVF